MARKSAWLPGQPGGQADPLDTTRWGAPSLTPLSDLISAGVAGLVAAGVAFWGFAIAGPLNLEALLVLVGALLVMLGVGIWRLQRGIRRINWRRKNTDLTGGRYLRAWERTPSNH